MHHKEAPLDSKDRPSSQYCIVAVNPSSPRLINKSATLMIKSRKSMQGSASVNFFASMMCKILLRILGDDGEDGVVINLLRRNTSD